jgi:hypothetical protein
MNRPWYGEESLSHLPASVAILHLIMILVPAGAATATVFPVPGLVRMFAPTLITPGVLADVTVLLCVWRTAPSVSTAAAITIMRATLFFQELLFLMSACPNRGS